MESRVISVALTGYFNNYLIKRSCSMSNKTVATKSANLCVYIGVVSRSLAIISQYP